MDKSVYVKLRKGKSHYQQPMVEDDGYLLDFDKNDELIGIEFIDPMEVKINGKRVT